MLNDYSEKIGGTEIYLELLIKSLEKKGHLVNLYSSDIKKSDYIKKMSDRSFTYLIKKLFHPYHYQNVKNICRTFHPDIVHVHSFYNELSPSVLFAISGIPVIMTVHDAQIAIPVSIQTERMGKQCAKPLCTGCTNCLGIKGFLYQKIKQHIYKLALARILLFITPSEFMAHILRLMGKNNSITIKNGFDRLPYAPITSQNQILFVGRLTKEKGVYVLLHSLKRIISQIKDIQLTIVGDGPEKERVLEYIHTQNLKNYVQIKTAVEHGEIALYYNHASVVVVPSIYADNLPTVCIEALSVGRPIVGSRAGGIPELIDEGKTGYLSEMGSADDLARKVVELLSQKNIMESMSKNARAKSADYTMEVHIEKILNCYQKAVTAYI